MICFSLSCFCLPFFFLIDVVQALLDWVLIAVGLGFYMFYEYCMQARIMIFYLFIYFGGGGLAPLNFGNKYILVFTFWKLLFIPFNFTCFESLKVTCFLFSSLILISYSNPDHDNLLVCFLMNFMPLL
jgi:hypothetical protein